MSHSTDFYHHIKGKWRLLKNLEVGAGQEVGRAKERPEQNQGGDLELGLCKEMGRSGFLDNKVAYSRCPVNICFGDGKYTKLFT